MPNKHLATPQLWVARVEESSQSLEQLSQELLDEAGLRRLANIKSDNKRRQYLLSRWLIRQSLSQYFCEPLRHWQIIEQRRYRPEIANLPKGFYHSLSHSHELIAFVLSASPVGIDIEKIKTRHNQLLMAEEFMSENELRHFRTCQDKHFFYRCWCLKEAYFKSLPPPIQSTISFAQLDTYSSTTLAPDNIFEAIVDGYQLTVYNFTSIKAISLSAPGEQLLSHQLHSSSTFILDSRKSFSYMTSSF